MLKQVLSRLRARLQARLQSGFSSWSWPQVSLPSVDWHSLYQKVLPLKDPLKTFGKKLIFPRLGVYAPPSVNVWDHVLFAVFFFVLSSVVLFNFFAYWNTAYMYYILILNSFNLIPSNCFYFLLPGSDLGSSLSKNSIRQWSRREKIITLVLFLGGLAEFVVGLLLNIARLREVLRTGSPLNKSLAFLAFMSLVLRGGATPFLAVFTSALFHHNPQQPLRHAADSAFLPTSNELKEYYQYHRKISRFCSKVLPWYFIVTGAFLLFFLAIILKPAWQLSILEKSSLWTLVYLSGSSGISTVVMFVYSIFYNRHHREIIRKCREFRDAAILRDGVTVPQATASAPTTVQTAPLLQPAPPADPNPWQWSLNLLEGEPGIKLFKEPVSLSYFIVHFASVAATLFCLFTGTELPW